MIARDLWSAAGGMARPGCAAVARAEKFRRPLNEFTNELRKRRVAGGLAKNREKKLGLVSGALC